MDKIRFDTLTRSLTAAGSRRRALTAVLAGALGMLGLAHPDEATAGKCKRKPTECEQCTKSRKGKKKPGKIKARANGTPCSSGSCQNGACIAAAVTPSPPGICAGKNTCAGTDPSGCHRPGASSVCLCWARADDTTTFCGSTVTRFGNSCSVCTEDETCVVLGGECTSGFACVGTCLDLR